MTEAEIEHFAKEAARLLSDDTLATAMSNVRMKALVELADVDASDTKEILRLQAIANCLQDVRDELQAAIHSQAAGGFDPNKRTA